MSLLDDLLGKGPTDPFGNPREPTLTEIWARRDADGLAKELTVRAEQTIGESRRPKSVTGKVLDLLSRGEYFSASLANSLLDPTKVEMGQALSKAFGEIVTPEQRMNFGDLMKKYAPEFSKEHPFQSAAIGLAGSIVLDPLNLIPFGKLATMRKMIPLSGVAIGLNVSRRGTSLTKQVVRKLADTPEKRRLMMGGEETAMMAESQRFIDELPAFGNLGISPEDKYAKHLRSLAEGNAKSMRASLEAAERAAKLEAFGASEAWKTRPHTLYAQSEKWEVTFTLNDGTKISRRYPSEALAVSARDFSLSQGGARLRKRFGMKKGQGIVEGHITPPKGHGKNVLGIADESAVAEETLLPHIPPSMADPVPSTYVQALADLVTPPGKVDLGGATARRGKIRVPDHPDWIDAQERQHAMLRMRLQDELDVSDIEAAASAEKGLGVRAEYSTPAFDKQVASADAKIAAIQAERVGLQSDSLRSHGVVTGLPGSKAHFERTQLLDKRLDEAISFRESIIADRKAAHAKALGRHKALPTDLSGWSMLPIDVGALAPRLVAEAASGKRADDVFAGSRLYPLSSQTIEELPIMGDIPGVVLVPPMLQSGLRISSAAKLEDLVYVVGSRGPQSLRDVPGALAKADETYDFARKAIAQAQKALDESILRTKRSNLLQSTLDELGLKTSDLIDQGGLYLLGKQVVTDPQMQRFFETMGISRTAAALRNLPGVDGLVDAWKSLRAKFSLTDEMTATLKDVGFTGDGIDKGLGTLVRWRSSVEARFLAGVKVSQALAIKMTSMLKNPESERRVTDVLLAAQDRVRKHLDSQVMEGYEGMGPHLANPTMLPDHEKTIMLEEARNAKLDESEMAMVASLIEHRRSMQELQGEIGMGTAQLLSYTPARWHLSGGWLGGRVKNALNTRRMVVDPHLQAIDGIPIRQAPGAELGWNPLDKRMHALAEHAKNDGWEPVYDMVGNLNLEFMQKVQARIQHEYRDGLNMMLPEEFKKALALKSEGALKTMAKLEGHLFRTMRHEPGLPDWNEAGRLVVKAVDSFNVIFKKAATTWNPAFIFKNLVGDIGLIAAQGTRVAFGKNYDPTAYYAAWLTVMRGKAPRAIEDAYGNLHTEEALIGYLRNYSVIKNTTVDGVGSAGDIQRSTKEARRHVERARAMNAFGEGHLPSAAGWSAIAARSMAYTDIPGKMTDVLRLSVFYNAISHGNDPFEAARLVDKTLFDYTKGLTAFEEATMARIMPFYRFFKFSTAMTVNLLATKPANVENLHKIVRTVGDVWNKIEKVVFDGERDVAPLTPSERTALGTWIFEQPHAFAGIDPVLKNAAFRTFNGLSFLDWMNFLQVDELGQMDMQRTAVSGGLAQMAPFLKMPLELLFKKDFFTEAAMGPDGRNLGPVNEEVFFRTMGTLIGGGVLGSGAGGAAGGVAADLLGRLGINGLISQGFGIERAVDPADGVEKTYANPYMIQVLANIFPPLRTALSVAREDRSFAEGVLRGAMGIGTVKLDLHEEANYRRRERQAEVSDSVSRLRKIFRQGRAGLRSEDNVREDLQEALQLLQDESRLLSAAPIRGDGRK